MVPYTPHELLSQIEEAEQEEKERKDRRHDWIVAIFGVVGGAISGGIVTLLLHILGLS